MDPIFHLRPPDFFIGDPKIFILDPQSFIKDPQVLIGDSRIYWRPHGRLLGDPKISLDTGPKSFLWRPQKCHQRPQIFFKGIPNFSS